MCSRHDVAQVQSLLQSPQHGKSRIAVERLEKDRAGLQSMQQEVQSMIQAAISRSATATQHLLNEAVGELLDTANAVQRQLDKLERSTVLTLSEENLSQVSTALEQLMQTRQDQVSTLHKSLKACQNGLGDDVSTLLLESSAKLRDVWNATDGSIEQLLQDTVREFNITALSNARAIEQVITNLEVVGVRLQKHVRQEYKQALEDWQLLHTKHVIAAFVENLKSTDMAKPLKTMALVEGMKKWQQDTAAKMGECVVHSVLSLQSLQNPDTCQESIDRAQALLQTWKLELCRQVESLNVSFEEFKLFSKRLVEGLYTECCSYNGCSPEDVHDMIQQQCAHILKSIESECEASIKQAIDGCTAQYGNWSHLTLQLGNFTSRCTHSVYTHAGKCRQLAQNAKKTFSLMLEQFDSDHQDMETAFDGLLEGVSAACEEEIDERRQEAAQLLTAVKDGFYTAKEKAMNFVSQQEQAVRDECEAYRPSLLSLLQVQQPAVKSPVAIDANNPDAPEGGNWGGVSTAQDAECTPDVEFVTIRDKELFVLKDLLTVLLEKETEVTEGNTDDQEHESPAGTAVASAEQTENNAQQECAQTPDPPLQEDVYKLPFPEEDIRAQLSTILRTTLANNLQHDEDCYQEMDQWRQSCHQTVMKRLDAQLQKHRPRDGVLEEDVYSKRRAVLRSQHLLVDSFLNRQTECIAKGVQHFDAKKAEVAKELESVMMENYEQLKTKLLGAQSRAAVNILQRAAHTTHKRLRARIEEDCATVTASSHQTLTVIIDALQRFKEREMVLTADGGTWAVRTVEVCSEQLQEVAQSVDAIKKKQSELAQQLQEQCDKQNDALLEELIGRIPDHSEDVCFLETASSEEADTERRIKSLLHKSTKCRDAIDSAITQLGNAINDTSSQSGNEIRLLLEAANSLRLQLACRATALDVVQSTGLAPVVVNTDIQLDPEPVVETPAPTKKGKPGKAEPTDTSNPLAVELPQPLLQDAEAILSSAQDALKAHAASYFSKRSTAREITRMSIKTDAGSFLASRQEHFSTLKATCDQHIASEQKSFGLQVMNAYRTVSALPKAVYNRVLLQEKTGMEKTVQYSLQQLSMELEAAAAVRKSHEAELSPTLAHPAQKACLTSLMEKEETRRAQAIGTIGTSACICRTAVVQGTVSTQRSLHNSVHILGQLLHSWVMPQDLLESVSITPKEDATSVERMSFQAMARLGSKVLEAESCKMHQPDDEAGGKRPFGVSKWDIKHFPAKQADLGWTHEIQQIFKSEEDLANESLDAGCQLPLRCISSPLHKLAVAGFTAASLTAVKMGKQVLTAAIASLQELQQQEDQVLRKAWMSMCTRLQKHTRSGTKE